MTGRTVRLPQLHLGRGGCALGAFPRTVYLSRRRLVLSSFHNSTTWYIRQICGERTIPNSNDGPTILTQHSLTHQILNHWHPFRDLTFFNHQEKGGTINLFITDSLMSSLSTTVVQLRDLWYYNPLFITPLPSKYPPPPSSTYPVRDSISDSVTTLLLDLTDQTHYTNLNNLLSYCRPHYPGVTPW